MSRTSRSRGQTLVLTALSMFIVMMMMMLTFNLSRAVHQRISLQQHSDALAFSTAVVEARALNYLAYSNRALASALVAEMTLHAHMAAATAAPNVFAAASNAFWVIVGLETALCALAICPGPCMVSMAQHCPHIATTTKVAIKYRKERTKWQKKVKPLEGKFRDAVKKLDDMMEKIHISQQAVATNVQTTLTSGNISALKDVNAPLASGIGAGVRALNLNNFGCALDGVAIGTCGRSGISKTAKAIVMTNVANASRTDWIDGRRPDYHFHPDLLLRLKNLPGRGITGLVGAGGTGKLIDRSNQLGGTNRRRQGKVIGANEHVDVSGFYHHIWVPGWGRQGGAEIFTAKTGNGRHRPSRTHQGTHGGWEGVNTEDDSGCASRGNCFIRFRATSEESDNYGQPMVYSLVTTGELRLNDQGEGGPWEVTPDGTITWDDGGNGTGFLRLTAGRGAAASKAMVYYHRIGDWREHPNMFNPFWRAKLHPFDSSGVEAGKVFAAAAETDAATMAPLLPIY